MARRQERVDWVSASEVGSYIFCSRQYWLAKVQKIPVTGAGAERLQAGTAAHHAHGVRYDWQRRFRKVALYLLGAGIIAAAFLFWMKSRGF